MNTDPECPMIPVTGGEDLGWAEELVWATGTMTVAEKVKRGGVTVGYVVGIADLTGRGRGKQELREPWGRWMEMYGRRRA
jgi:hypothetical protein